MLAIKIKPVPLYEIFNMALLLLVEVQLDKFIYNIILQQQVILMFMRKILLEILLMQAMYIIQKVKFKIYYLEKDMRQLPEIIILK